ncbi:hypothetical protein JCM33374_g5291 [Metschnikowia sp. JCM 33374]|nr:hypothetical protein JCM33374_g5291 [Metschnikowia sp. JCM 33374]
MDFVSAFGKTKAGYDNILVVVDRLSKMAHLIPTTPRLQSDGCAQLLSKHVFALHGFPLTVVSDQDKLFREKVWGAYMKLWGIETRCLNGMSLLPMVEFAYNNSVHSAIQTTPFFANYGFHPRFFASFPEPNLAEKNAKRVAAQVFALDQQTILHQVRDRMAETQVVMSRDANRHRSFLTFALGDDVLVHRDSLIATSVSDRKFSTLLLGPVKITKVINDNAYEVSLPEGDLKLNHSPGHPFHLKNG